MKRKEQTMGITRLIVLGTIVRENVISFTGLKKLTGLTDGNVIGHIRKLLRDKLIKSFQDKNNINRSITVFQPTEKGIDLIEKLLAEIMVACGYSGAIRK